MEIEPEGYFKKRFQIPYESNGRRWRTGDGSLLRLVPLTYPPDSALPQRGKRFFMFTQFLTKNENSIL